MAKRKNRPEPDLPVERLPLAPKPMRRGSLSERHTKCGKAGCPCAIDPEARHGPYFSLTRAVGGATKSRWLKPAEAEIVRRQIGEGDEFRRQVQAYWEDCEELADTEMETVPEASSDKAEKGGFKRRLRRKLRKRLSG